MRVLIAAFSLPLALTLTACGGGGGVNSGSSLAGSDGGASTTPTTPVTTTPTTPTTTTPAPYTATQANMFDVAAVTTFDAVGAMHSLKDNPSGSTLYRGNASTVAAPSGKISYDPRDGIFVMTLADTKAGINQDITFQDPRHRATQDRAADATPQVPLLSGFNYLTVLVSTHKVPASATQSEIIQNTNLSFFYQRPNKTGSFVSLAGFEFYHPSDETGDPKTKSEDPSITEQGVFVFGAQTTIADVPTNGAARFNGSFLATIINQQADNPSQQWLTGTSVVDVDFAKRSLSLALTGTVLAAYRDGVAVSNASVQAGASFDAAGSASWAAAANSFTGKFASAGFTVGTTKIPVDFTAVAAGTSTAGASSIDGAFYGPGAKNIGGNFRIVGGIPDQRVDILGGFIGAKP